MSFRAVFIAITLSAALILAAWLINSRRPRVVVEEPSPAFVRASGKCAECHRNAQYSVVHTGVMAALRSVQLENASADQKEPS
jgi:hypothetical protein